MNADTQRRVRACFVAAIFNFLVLLLPKLEGIVFISLVALGILLNVISIWLILSGIKPMAGESDHLEAVAYAKRGITFLGCLMTIALVVASFAGAIEKQAVPFLVLGYVFLLLLPMKIFGLAVERRIREKEDG